MPAAATTATTPSSVLEKPALEPTSGLLGSAPPSPAGPVTAAEPEVRMPQRLRTLRALQMVRINWRQARFMFKARREIGEVFGIYGPIGEDVVVTSHPDHVRSLFTADPALAPSLTGESPLRPIVGPNSVLTLVGPGPLSTVETRSWLRRTARRL